MPPARSPQLPPDLPDTSWVILVVIIFILMIVDLSMAAQKGLLDNPSAYETQIIYKE